VAATDVIVSIVFYAIAALMVVAGISMVVAQHMIRSALLLIVVLSGVAILYMMLSADFLAVAQLLVYVGAIAVLMLFAIMLTPAQVDLSGGSSEAQKISAALTALVVGVIAISVVTTHPWNLRASPLNVETTERIGMLLLNTYVLPFWIASILLTVGLIGAIVIAREE